MKNRIKENETKACFLYKCCKVLLYKELLECIEFIDWTTEIGAYRYDSYLSFSWLVDRHAPSFFNIVSVESDCNELRLW